jgi:hypothetical protein
MKVEVVIRTDGAALARRVAMIRRLLASVIRDLEDILQDIAAAEAGDAEED